MSAFAPLLQSLTRHRGVLACLVASAEDGIVVDGTAHVGVGTNAFAALTAALCRRAQRASDAAGFGPMTFFELEAEGGRVLAAGRNGLLVIVVGERELQVGLVRVELRRAVEAL